MHIILIRNDLIMMAREIVIKEERSLENQYHKNGLILITLQHASMWVKLVLFDRNAFPSVTENLY